MAKRKPGSKSKSSHNSQSSQKKAEPSPKAKVEKTQPEEQEIEEGAMSASQAAGIVDAIERNRIILIGISVAVFAVICLFFVFKQLGTNRSSNAARAYTSAAIAKDVNALNQVVSNFGGSNAAGNALLTTADIRIENGEFEEAKSALNKMAQEYSSHPLHAQAYYKLGNLKMRQPDGYDAAIADFEKTQSVQPNSELAFLSALKIGDLELAKGNTEIAKQRYDDVLSTYGEGSFKNEVEGLVKSRKMRLNIKMPRGIPAPKEAEPESAEPESAEPESAEPESAEPESAEPESAEPESAEPESTEPESADPEGGAVQPTEGETSSIKSPDLENSESGTITLSERVQTFANRLAGIETVDETTLDQIYTDLSADGSSKFLYRIPFQTGGSGVPKAHQQPLIDKLKSADSAATIVTIGYADIQGDDSKNKELSYSRAQEVGGWIKGTLGNDTAIEFFAMGETERFSKTDYSKNRVVEVWQVAK